QDGAGQQEPRLQTDDRRYRQQRVPEHVAPVDSLRGQALRAGRTDVILILDVENRGAGDPGDDRQRDRAERERGQDQMVDHVAGNRALISATTVRREATLTPRSPLAVVFR